MKLQSSPKVFENYRCDTPKNTLARIEQGFGKLGMKLHYTSISGAKSRLNINYPTLGVYSGMVRIAGYPSQFVALGKGTTDILSRASGYAELAERFSMAVLLSYYSEYARRHGLVTQENWARLANLAYLKGYTNAPQDQVENGLGLEEVMAEQGFEEADFAFFRDLDLAQHWAEAYSLTEEQHFKLPLPWILTLCGSNGLASGNTREEAISHATCELFERYTAWYVVKNRLAVPTIDPDSIEDERIQRFIELFRSIGVESTIKDFSLGGTYPCIAVLFTNTNMRDDPNRLKRDHFSHGLSVGAHLNRTEALIRCFTEEAQGWPLQEYRFHASEDALYDYWTKDMGRAYGMPSDEYAQNTGVDRNEPLRHGDVSFLREGESIAYDTLPSSTHGDSLEDVNELVELCHRIDRRLLVVDVTNPVLDFPTVLAYVPVLSTFGQLMYNFRENYEKSGRKEWLVLSRRLDLKDYQNSDDWLRDPEQLKALIAQVEDYLRMFLDNNSVNLDTRLLPVCLFQLMAFANLQIRDYENALHYLNLQAIKERQSPHIAGLEKIRDYLRDQLDQGEVDHEALLAYLADQPGHFRCLIKTPPRNPLHHICDGPCDQQCEAAIAQKVKAAYDAFVKSRQGDA